MNSNVSISLLVDLRKSCFPCLLLFQLWLVSDFASAINVRFTDLALSFRSAHGSRLLFETTKAVAVHPTAKCLLR